MECWGMRELLLNLRAVVGGKVSKRVRGQREREGESAGRKRLWM